MIVDNIITLEAGELRRREEEALIKKLTFNDTKEREVSAYQRWNGGLRIHRGAWNLLPNRLTYTDKRLCPSGRKLDYTVTLDAEGYEGQEAALKAMCEEEQGLIVAQPGFGKTQVALAFAAQCETPTLVLVHTQDIFNQWVQYTKEAIPDATVGTIQGSKWVVGDITIAMIQTVWDQLEKFEKKYAHLFGCVIADEAHHAGAMTWEIVINKIAAKYRFGFTATQRRADGLHPLMQCVIGPIIYKQKIQVKVDTKVIPVYTELQFKYRGAFDWNPLLNALVTDEKRNNLIAQTALRQISKGHSTLILSRRIEHLHLLREEMIKLGVDENEVKILTGRSIGRSPMLNQFREGKFKCLLSTQLMDESVDVPILSRVILTFPGKHDGRIIQQVGRAIRQHEGKSNAIVFDIVDKKVRLLYRQWSQRKQAYKQMNIPIKSQSKEDAYVTQKEQKRDVQDRINKRIKRGRLTKRGLSRKYTVRRK